MRRTRLITEPFCMTGAGGCWGERLGAPPVGKLKFFVFVFPDASTGGPKLRGQFNNSVSSFQGRVACKTLCVRLITKVRARAA